MSHTPVETLMNFLALAALIVLPAADVSAEPLADTVDTEWTFRARVTDCRIHMLKEHARFGVAYTAPAIKEAKDGATLVVGFDARWLVTLAILDHGNDPLGFKQIKTLNLVIHSPAISLNADKPKDRDFDLALGYRISKGSGYSFRYLHTGQPRKPQ